LGTRKDDWVVLEFFHAKAVCEQDGEIATGRDGEQLIY
jgi:hypothetical protein